MWAAPARAGPASAGTVPTTNACHHATMSCCAKLARRGCTCIPMDCVLVRCQQQSAPNCKTRQLQGVGTVKCAEHVAAAALARCLQCTNSGQACPKGVRVCV